MARTGTKKIIILEDGVVVSTDVNSMNFVGSGVDVSAIGFDIELDFSGGGGSGTTIEVPTGTVDDSNVAFVFTAKPKVVVVNGQAYRENHGWSWSGLTATLDFAPGTDGDIYGIM